mmetsp:Transcript_29279/g.61540  ORF Transcript_29279/g.61540 Transcript_29279/m.61540 type:complete len:212 (+) Transcript_29279:641-1276(+)
MGARVSACVRRLLDRRRHALAAAHVPLRAALRQEHGVGLRAHLLARRLALRRGAARARHRHQADAARIMANTQEGDVPPRAVGTPLHRHADELPEQGARHLQHHYGLLRLLRLLHALHSHSLHDHVQRLGEPNCKYHRVADDRATGAGAWRARAERDQGLAARLRRRAARGARPRVETAARRVHALLGLGRRRHRAGRSEQEVSEQRTHSA